MIDVQGTPASAEDITKKAAIVAVDLGMKIIDKMVGDSITLDRSADTAELLSAVIRNELKL